MVDAYGFTDSERRVTELVAQGLSTRQITGRLHVSPYTVQDQLTPPGVQAAHRASLVHDGRPGDQPGRPSSLGP